MFGGLLRHWPLAPRVEQAGQLLALNGGTTGGPYCFALQRAGAGEQAIADRFALQTLARKLPEQTIFGIHF